MATLYVSYLTKAFLACAECAPFDVIVQLEPGLAAQQNCIVLADTWAYQTIRAVVTQVVKRGSSYEYTLSYEDTDVLLPTLDPAAIKGIACYGPLAAFAADRAGFDTHLLQNDDGTYTFSSQHGCEYTFGFGDGGLSVVDSDSINFTLSDVTGLTGDIKISADLGNTITVHADGLFAAAGWSTLGNTSTIEGTNFLGTTDNVPFSIRVNNERAVKYVPHSTPSIVGGYHDNEIPTATGAVIAGGGAAANLNQILAGDFSAISGGENNIIHECLGGVIGGGASNVLLNNIQFSAIGGGLNNIVVGSYSTIAGGRLNQTEGTTQYGFIGGGYANELNGNYGVVGGGQGNRILGNISHGVIVGGVFNTVSAPASVIVGGSTNIINNPSYSFIGAGSNNTIDNSNNASILGGTTNHISNNSHGSVIAGGNNHYIDATSVQCFIGSGQTNRIEYAAATSAYSSIVGGTNNTIQDAQRSFIGGGQDSKIYPSSNNSFIGGGRYNLITSQAAYSVVVGGEQNQIGTAGAVNNGYAFMGGGKNNVINDAPYGIVLGGLGNSLTGSVGGVIVSGVANILTSSASFIGTGADNTITSSQQAAILAGNDNRLVSSANSAILCGLSNRLNADSSQSVILSGTANTITTGTNSGILGGAFNTVLNCPASTVVGGLHNKVQGANGHSILGGQGNTIVTAGQSGSSILGGASLKVGAHTCGWQSASTRTEGVDSFSPSQVDISAFSNVFYVGDADLWVGNTGTRAGVKLFANNTDLDFSSSRYVKIRTSATLQESYILQLPDNDLAGVDNFPTVGNVLKVLSTSSESGVRIVQVGWAAP